MKSILVSLLFSIAALLPAADVGVEHTYPAAEAKLHIGEAAIVVGVATQVRTLQSGLTLVNLDGRYPDSPFTAVVQPAQEESVGDLKPLEGKKISVKGKITEYKGKPQIEITVRADIVEIK